MDEQAILQQEQQIQEKIDHDMDELKSYTESMLARVLDKNNWYIVIKHVHASGHGWQHINHWNSKAQLHFNVDKFYKDFNLKDKTREDFERIFGSKNITRDQSTVVLENQETRYASKNEENVINHLRQLLLELFKEEKQRIQTEISQETKQEQALEKKRHSEKKKRRKEKKVRLNELDN